MHVYVMYVMSIFVDITGKNTVVLLLSFPPMELVV
jgi:hypothetical protein